MNLLDYLPILLFLVIGVLVGVVPMLIGKVLSPSLPDAEKLSTYECGFEPFEDARMQFDIRYYLVAILFIFVRDLFLSFSFTLRYLAPRSLSVGGCCFGRRSFEAASVSNSFGTFQVDECESSSQ